MSDLEDLLAYQIRVHRFPAPEREYKAIQGRRFKWDFAWPEDFRLLVEVQGAIWVKGGHSTGTGITRDCEKKNLAAIKGFYTMAFTADQIKSGEAINWLGEFFANHEDISK